MFPSVVGKRDMCTVPRKLFASWLNLGIFIVAQDTYFSWVCKISVSYGWPWKYLRFTIILERTSTEENNTGTDLQ